MSTEQLECTPDQYCALERIVTNDSLETPLLEQIFDELEPPTEIDSSIRVTA